MRRSITFAVLLAFALVLTACTVALPYAERALTPPPSVIVKADTSAPAQTARRATSTVRATSAETTAGVKIEELALPNEQLQALGAAILEQDLLAEIAGARPLTLLAPSDEAFGSLDAVYVSGLLGDRGLLKAFVSRHVISGTLSLASLAAGPAQTISGEPLTVIAGPEGVTIQGARVLQGDIAVPFGLVHVIDRILPEAVVTAKVTATVLPSATALPTLTAANTATSAPTETAMPTATTAKPTVGPTGTATLRPTATASRPTAAPTATTAPSPTLPAATPTARPTPTTAVAARPLDVMARIRATAGLSRIAELLQLAGLDEIVGARDGLTMLAPNDEAFAELTEAELSGLTADPDALKSWLERYILTARYSSAELSRMTAVNTLSGDSLAIRSRPGTLIIGGTRVVERDIAATNGVIHTVDTVVLP
jgi:uncharacterized surface protein with fasciclin (FAS1) repeats